MDQSDIRRRHTVNPNSAPKAVTPHHPKTVRQPVSGKGKSTFLIAQSPWPMSSPVRAPPAGAALSITDQAKSPKPAMDRLNALTVAAQNPP
jgi:hypothetical protein